RLHRAGDRPRTRWLHCCDRAIAGPYRSPRRERMTLTRLQRVRQSLAEHELDGLLVSSPVDDVFGNQSPNRRWLSGFTGSTGHALVTADMALIVADFRYTEQAARECV